LANLDYVFYQHPNFEEKGILTGINIKQLDQGRHKLRVKVKQAEGDTITVKETIELPFFIN